MYKFNIKNIVHNGEIYYTIFIDRILLKDQEVQLNNDLRMNFRAELLDTVTGESLDEENPLKLLKTVAHSQYPNSKLMVDIYDSDNVLWFSSTDLDNYIDLEIRAKFPNEDIDTVKIDFISSILKFIEEKDV